MQADTIQPAGHGSVTALHHGNQPHPPHAAHHAPVASPAHPTHPAPAVNANHPDYAAKLLDDHRIHVDKGALFIGTNRVLSRYLLDPQNDAKLKETLHGWSTQNYPSLFLKPERQAMLNALEPLLPKPLETEHAAVTKTVEDFNRKVQTGVDPKLQEANTDRQQPMLATVRETVKQSHLTPMQLAGRKNAVLMYLLLQEKLARLNYGEEVLEYTAKTNPATTDQVLGSLQKHIGIAPMAIRQAAEKGVDAVGHLLGIDALTIARIKEVVDYAQTRDFSANVILNYHYGRESGNLPLPQQLEAGMQQRIAKKSAEYRLKAHDHFSDPIPVQQEEARVAQLLKDTIAPEQLELLYKQGYGIAYTPENMADKIAFQNRLYGMHDKAANSRLDILGGTPMIYFSSHDKVLENQQATLAHEVAHNLYPDRFTFEQVQTIDQLIATDAARLEKLHVLLSDHEKVGVDEATKEEWTKSNLFGKLLAAYKAGTPEQKPAVLKATNDWLASEGIPGADVTALFPHLTDISRLQHMVDRAYNTLRIDGAQYLGGGLYGQIPARMREMVSRFAELKQVRLRGEPELLTFIAPGMNQVWTQHYIPQVKELIAAVDAQKAKPATPQPAPVAHDASASLDQLQQLAATSPITVTPPVTLAVAPIVPPVAPPIAVSETTSAMHSAGCSCGTCGGQATKPASTVATPVAMATQLAAAAPGVQAVV